MPPVSIARFQSVREVEACTDRPPRAPPGERVYALAMTAGPDVRATLVQELRISNDEIEELICGDEQRMTALVELVALLDAKLASRRLPEVVRVPAPAFGGRSLLDVAREDGPASALIAVRESFAWHVSA